MIPKYMPAFQVLDIELGVQIETGAFQLVFRGVIGNYTGYGYYCTAGSISRRKS